MKYPQISSLVPAGEFFDESAVGEGVYLTTTHLQAIEQSLATATDNVTAVQSQLDEANASVTALQAQVAGMHSTESVDALNARITALEAENKELGKGASGNGTVVETSAAAETGETKKAVTINDASHPVNQQVNSYLEARRHAQNSKPKF